MPFVYSKLLYSTVSFTHHGAWCISKSASWSIDVAIHDYQILYRRYSLHVIYSSFMTYSVSVSFSAASSNTLTTHLGEYVIGTLNRTWFFSPISLILL